MGEPPGGFNAAWFSPSQRRIVEFPVKAGHLLVLAGPGAGKTRTLIARIGWLLDREICAPEQILALTFTHQAALDLRERLGQRGEAGVTAATFHAFCADLLQRYGAAIGVPLPLRIVDRVQQGQFVVQAAETIGCALAERRTRGGPPELTLRDVSDHLQRRKRSGTDPGGWRPDWPPSPVTTTLARIDEVYCALLRESGVLDYDDLLVEAIRLLRSDDETATLVRRRHRYLFVDELHDVSPEQYELLRLLAPPVRSRSRIVAPEGDEPAWVMAVADPEQAIYAWRGADAAATLRTLRRDYRPVEHRLRENYRSTASIARVADWIALAGDDRERPGPGPVQPDGLPVYCVESPDETEEAARLAGYVERAITSGNFTYEDIAILFRTHGRGDAAEDALLSRGIPLRRVQPDRFFDQPDVQETLRYLDLTAALRDASFEPALNWPRVVVDELGMACLRRAAAARGLRLPDLVGRLDELGEGIGPLTRVAIEDFAGGLARGLDASPETPVVEAVERLLALLARRRSPMPSAERANLRGLLAFLGPPLAPLVDALAWAVDARRLVALLHADDLDTTIAAVILEHALTRYLRHPAVVRSRSEGAPEGAFAVVLGEPVPPGPDGFGIGERTTRSMRYAVSTLAWRLGQLLLMRSERLDAGRFAVIDLETGSNHANTTELLELGAVRVDRRHISGETFSSLVRPSSPRAITCGAHEAHGLNWANVRDAPASAEALPAFFEFLGDDTVVGHNVAAFDALVLRRVATQVGVPALQNPIVDTLALARRLLRDQPHALGDLAQGLGIAVGRRHRAEADAHLTAEVFLRLTAILREERELDALTEALPLVAIGILVGGVPVVDEHETLVLAGARAAAMGQGMTLLDRLRSLRPASEEPERELGRRLRRVAEDDDRWIELEVRWRRTVEGYLAAGNDPSLAAFLRYAALATSLDEDLDARDRVTMMTVHSAKGKEWPLVFLLGAEDGTLPDWRSTTPEALDEERRVLYVGMTRAMHRLCLMWSASSNAHDRSLSRFLRGLPAGLIEHRR